MKAKRKTGKILSLVLSFVLALGILPFEPTVVHAANATIVYITDAVGGDTQTVTTDIVDSEGGWSYAAGTATLTLNSFNGAYIEANGDLNIVLNGANTITMASDSEYGIKTDGKLTIEDATSPAVDSLDIICNEPDAYPTMIYTGGYGADMATYIDGGTVRLKGTTTKNGIVGVSRWLYVNNDANLDIDLSAGENNVNMIGISTFYQYTSGVVSVSVDTLDSFSYLIYSLYQQGTGDINLTSEGKAKVISYEFYQYSGGTGTVTVKGYLNDFRPVKKTCTVEGYDNVIWSYYTTNPLGTGNGHFLCDSTGTPIKDPVIKYVESQPLTVTDSPIYDIPEKKVGDSFNKANIYWYLGCKGGTGNYSFYLADDSDPLPEGVSVNSGGGFNGEPTDAHAAGEVKIKVVSGTETAYFNVNYGEITYNNPVTSMELDKTEATINKGESVELTATIMPENADKRNVNWSCSSTLGKLEELSFDGNSNKRTARFTAGNTAGALDITASSLIGGFKKKCTVYIKESKPTASAGNVYIQGLEAGKAYTVNGTAYTADSSGRIEIEDSWRETTVSIVRTNEEPKCNSDALMLTVGKYTLVDINTLTEDVSLEYSSTTYDGNKKEPQVSISGLTQDTHYTVSYENNVNAGKATVIITGIGDYCGTLYKYFTIDKASIEKFDFTLSDTEYTYDKTEKKPEISVSGLIKDTDYTVAYKNNTAAGTATVTITGKGNYTGIVVKNFTINPASIEGKEVNISVTEYEYDGTAKTPVISILGLTKDVDYKVEYSDNILVGTAKAVVTGIGNYKGIVVKNFTIKDTGEKPHSHTFDQEIIKPKALKTAADCTNDAVYYKSCSCGEISTTETFTATDTALGHDYAATWSNDETNHWHECKRCHDKRDTAAHDFGGDDICDTCKYDKSVPHTHNLTLVPASPATCTTSGNITYYTCDGCDKWFEDAAGSVEIMDKTGVVIAAKSHTYVLVSEVPATKDSTGIKEHYECSVCGKLFDLDKNEVTASELVIPKLEPTVKYGDLNGDGKINLLDLIAMRKYLAKWSITVDLAAADCNADGKINLLDLILMRKYLAKWNVVLGPQK